MPQPTLEIEVRGTAKITRYPERAILSLKIASEGPSQETVSQDVSSTCTELHQSFTTLAPKTPTGDATPEAAITTFSTTSLRSWSDLPLDYQTRKPQPRVYHASSSFEVFFRNFETLGHVASKLFLTSHVTVNSISYRLTEPSLQALGAESRKQAMADAIAKAKDYASVLGREVVAVKVTDEGASAGGMTAQSRAQQQVYMASMPSSQAASDGLSLTPEKVVLTGSIRVKFCSVD